MKKFHRFYIPWAPYMNEKGKRNHHLATTFGNCYPVKGNREFLQLVQMVIIGVRYSVSHSVAA